MASFLLARLCFRAAEDALWGRTAGAARDAVGGTMSGVRRVIAVGADRSRRFPDRLDGRAIKASGGYVSGMTERVAELLERVQQLSTEECEEFDRALVVWRARKNDENDALDDEASDEAVRRLRVLQQGGPKGRTVDAYFDELEARARARSA